MPAKTIEWTLQARRDLLDVVAHLRGERPSAARRFVRPLDKRLRVVARFPESGRPIPEEVADGPAVEPPHREVIVMRWRIGYALSERITVLYVLHGARQFPPLR
jgi:plasmid stabilization system protein ParE